MKRLIYILAGVLVLLTIGYWFLMQDYAKTPPTFYYNARIITLNEQSPTAEAMYVKDGKIEAIGSKITVDATIPKNTAQVDLDGAIVMPGFIDPHSHFALSMFMDGLYDLSGFKHQSNAEVWKYFEEKVQEAAPGEWIICKGIDPVLVPDLAMPSLEYLDKVAPKNPVFMFTQSLHNYFVNTKALELAGVNKETPNPSKESYYAKDAQGELTGLIVEQQASRPFLELITDQVVTPDLLSSSAVQVLKDYARNGNTTIVTTGLTIKDAKPLILFKHLCDEKPSLLGKILEKLGMLPSRVPSPRHMFYMRHDVAHLLPNTKSENDFYNIIGIKHWYDGSPYIGSMYVSEPYLDNEFTHEKLHIPAQYSGKALIHKDTLRSFIRNFHQKGWQIAIHTQGDQAIAEVLDAYEELSNELDFKNARHRLEHCLLLPESDLDRMKTLNITPSFHVNHIYYYGDALKDSLLGEERTSKLLPIASTGKKGIKYSLHADQPMFESKPFRLIQTAIERQTKSGDTIADNQKIELLAALKAMTIDAAWQIHMEDKIGSLEKGKYADFIILDKDPFKTPVTELENIQCLKTFVNGNLVQK